MDHLIKSLEHINKNDVVDHIGTTYADFRRSLKPVYSKIYIYIAFGYIGLFLILFLILILQRNMPKLFLLTIPIGGFILGYIIAYIQLFFHEAAHFNIAKNRKLNDVLANIFIGALTGQNIQAYRQIHWEHHRRLGETVDTENSYFDPLNTKLLVQSLLGIKAAKVFLTRKKYLEQIHYTKTMLDWIMVIAGFSLNISIVTILYLNGYWQATIAWIIGVIMFYPFFGTLRQLLEHRDYSASKELDYNKVNHGKVTRLFKKGIIGSTFGGAGFRRHLLHHWDPLISCTQLDQVESFLLNTKLKEPIKTSTTHYMAALIKLLK